MVLVYEAARGEIEDMRLQEMARDEREKGGKKQERETIKNWTRIEQRKLALRG